MDIVQAQLIRDLEDDRLYERQLARRWIAVGTVLVAVSLVIYIIILGKHSYKDPEGTVLVFLLALFVVGNTGIVMNAYRLYEAYKLALPEMPETPPGPDPSDELTFNQEHDGPKTKIEYRHDNTVELGEFTLTTRQWRALVSELRRNTKYGIPLWSRERIIHVNGVKFPERGMPRTEGTSYQAFIGLTAKNDEGQTQFSALTDALQDLNIVHSSRKRLTNYGWEELSRLANMPVL